MKNKSANTYRNFWGGIEIVAIEVGKSLTVKVTYEQSCRMKDSKREWGQRKGEINGGRVFQMLENHPGHREGQNQRLSDRGLADTFWEYQRLSHLECSN